MPVKLFGQDWQTETRQTMALLEDAKIKYEFIDPTESMNGLAVMFASTGTKRTPVLCVDGKAYRGLEHVRRYFTR